MQQVNTGSGGPARADDPLPTAMDVGVGLGQESRTQRPDLPLAVTRVSWQSGASPGPLGATFALDGDEVPLELVSPCPPPSGMFSTPSAVTAAGPSLEFTSTPSPGVPPYSTNATARPMLPLRPLPPLAAEPDRVARSLTKQRRRLRAIKMPATVHELHAVTRDQWLHVARGLQHRHVEAGLATVALVSPTSGEGTTTVALILSLALDQQAQLRVLLVEAPHRPPALARTLRVSVAVGLDEALDNVEKLPAALIHTRGFSLLVKRPQCRWSKESSSREVIASRFSCLLNKVRHHFDFVVIDAGAMLPTGWSIPAPHGIDAALLVHDPARSDRAQVQATRDYLDRWNIPCLGMLENGST